MKLERRMRMLVLALLAAGVVGAMASGGAAAATPTVRANFQVPASNGYVLRVSAYADHVSVTASGFLGDAEYTVPGRVTPDGIWANFGKRGRVAVEFRRSGSLNRRVPPGRCEGKRRTLHFGTFVGTIRFAGEDRYTEVDVRRGWGNRYVERRWKCSPPKRRGGGGRCVEEEDDGETVTLGVASPRHRARLFAFADRSPTEAGFTFVGAESEELLGRMEVVRTTTVGGPDRIFTYVPDLSLATLSPPRPFTGSATFQRNADGTTAWTGDLRVSLPGAPDLALAGPSFEADLDRPESEGSVACFFGTGVQRAVR